MFGRAAKIRWIPLPTAAYCLVHVDSILYTDAILNRQYERIAYFIITVPVPLPWISNLVWGLRNLTWIQISVCSISKADWNALNVKLADLDVLPLLYTTFFWVFPHCPVVNWKNYDGGIGGPIWSSRGNISYPIVYSHLVSLPCKVG